MKLFKPPGAHCQKCTLPIAFRKQTPESKWTPCEPDGSDHWDKCNEAQVRLGLRRAGPKQMVAGVTERRDFSLPDFDGNGVPWEI